jgi:hypothetical protein
MLANIITIIKSFVITNKAMILTISPMILPKIKSILSSTCEKMKTNKISALLGLALLIAVSQCSSKVKENRKLKTDLAIEIESSKRQQKQETMGDLIQQLFDSSTKEIHKELVYDNRNATSDVKKLNKIMSNEIEEINNLSK